MSNRQRSTSVVRDACHLRRQRTQEAVDVAAALAAAAPALRVVAEQRRCTVTCLDTFEWSLLRAGLVLDHVRSGGEATLSLRAVDAPPTRSARAVDAPPGRAADVRGGFLRARLTELTDARALLAVARVARQESRFELRDEEGKLRLRVTLRADRPGRGRVDRYLLLEPVTGYAAEARRVRRALTANGWTTTADPVHEAAVACGSAPLDYPLPPNVPLHPAMPTLAAVQATALRLQTLMEMNLPGLCADLDTEFLHDFRVALRRTRTLLGEVRGVFPAPVLRRFKREFRWLGALSGPVRDGDVQLQEMTALGAALGAGDRADMAPFHAWLAGQRESARTELLRALAGARYRRLARDWRVRLQRPVPQRSALANSTRPVAEVAAETVRRAFKRVLGKGRRIDSSSPPARLHELRKDAKRLRYVIETFRPLYRLQAVDALVKDLKALQDNLGEHQDVEVQRQLMEAYAPLAPPPTGELLGRLAATLARREARVRAEFADRFAAFDSGAVKRHLKSMLNELQDADAA